ncbi:hypothetical protein AB8849_11090 [Proteus vulgaris]
MSEHFQGKFEVELKYHLQHPEEFITALKKAGATLFTPNNQETDWYMEHTHTKFPGLKHKFVCEENVAFRHKSSYR